MSTPTLDPQPEAAASRVARAVTPGDPFAEARAPQAARPKRGLGTRFLDVFRDDAVFMRELLVLRLPRYRFASMFALLASSGLVYLLCQGSGHRSEVPPEMAQQVFLAFFSSAVALIGVLSAAYAATLITGERERGTYESLILTTLTPGRIVRGKFLAVVVASLLLFIHILPSVGLAIFFGASSLAPILVGFAVAVLGVSVGASLGLAASSRSPTTTSASLAAFLAAFAVAVVCFSTFASVIWGPGLAQRASWLILGAVVSAILLIWIGLAAAITGLRPPGTDRTTPIKVWMVVTAALGVLALGRHVSLGEVHLRSLGSGLGMVMLAAALLPPDSILPPRGLSHERSRLRRRLLEVFGSHAFASVRFTAALSVLLALGSLAAVVLGSGGATLDDEEGRGVGALALELAGYVGLTSFYALAHAHARVSMALGAPKWLIRPAVVLAVVHVGAVVLASASFGEVSVLMLFTVWGPSALVHAAHDASASNIALVLSTYAVFSALLFVRLRRMVAAEAARRAAPR